MSIFSGTIYSSAMNMDTTIAVVLPHDSRKHRGIDSLHEGIEARDCPRTLILLHGLSDNYTAWVHRTSVLRYAEEYDIAVVIPEVQRSFYQNMVNGPSYFDYVTDELPSLVSKMFNISTSPEDLFIAGLSMGGYGAMACGLRYPERFKGIGSFSAVCDLRSVVTDNDFAARKELQGWLKDRKAIFGEDLTYPDDMDLHNLLDKVSQTDTKPQIFQACGTEDFLYDQNTVMRDHINELDWNFIYEEWPGTHEWGFWDLAIQKMLNHFLLD